MRGPSTFTRRAGLVGLVEVALSASRLRADEPADSALALLALLLGIVATTGLLVRHRGYAWVRPVVVAYGLLVAATLLGGKQGGAVFVVALLAVIVVTDAGVATAGILPRWSGRLMAVSPAFLLWVPEAMAVALLVSQLAMFAALWREPEPRVAAQPR